MGRIRLYSNRYAGVTDMGDPFSLRIPRKLRKLQVGRALGKVATAAVSFVPGVGGLLSPLLQRLNAVSAKYGVDPSLLQGFARQYGLDVGDPATPARDRASQTPRQKAKAKADKKAAPKGAKVKTKPGTTGKKGIDLSGIGSAIGGAFKGAVGSTADLAGKAVSGNYADALKELLGGKDTSGSMPGTFKLPGMHKRRHMNPTNVKALRRGIRRLEGFERLVKSVERAYPRLRRAHGTSSPRRGGRGHRAGCGCAVCKRAA